MPPRPIGVDDPVQKLLAARVDPALLLDGADDEKALVLLELRIGTGPVHLGGGREDDALPVFDALLDDIEVHLEIEIVHADWVFHIQLRRGDGDERHHDVAFLDMVFDPLLVDGDVSFEEMKARIVDRLVQTVRPEVHAVDGPVSVLQDAMREVMSDEAVDAENENFHVSTIPSLSLKYSRRAMSCRRTPLISTARS